LRKFITLKKIAGRLARLLLVIVFLFLGVYSARSQCSIYAGNDTAVCLNAPLSSTATITNTGGTVTSIVWTTIPATIPTNGSTINIPTSTAGTFTYAVTAILQGGCATTDTLIADTIIITVNPRPTASFIFGPNNECGSVPVLFTNTSSGIGLSYSWNFGDPNSGTANTSSATSLYHHFIGTPGVATQTFTVTLIATSSSGCKDTVTQQVTIKQSPGTQLGGTGQLVYNGLNYFTTCSTSASAIFNFTNQSATAATNVSYTIVWGDASPNFTATNFAATSHTYTTGNYTLLFIVTGAAPNSCTDTATYYVFVGSNPAVGLNNPGNTTVCSGVPLTFPISGTSTNPPGTNYTVIFNDNSPQIQLSHPPPAGISHAFNITSCGTISSDGTNIYPNSFSAIIVAANPCGTSSSSVVPIYVSQRPEASFIIAPNDTVCVNNVVTFTNTSQTGNTVQNGVCTPGKGVWSVSPATGWTISSGSLGNDFGLNDPGTWLAGSNVLQLNFTAIGTYTIKLKTGGSTFCNNDFIEKTICVNQIPVAAFSVNQNSGCAPLIVNTTNSSSLSNCGNNTFNWSVTYTPTTGCTPASSGYTYINGTNSTSVNPQFQFNNPGVYTIGLIAIAPGGACTSSLVTQQITIKEKPVVTFPALPTICLNQSVNPTIISTCNIANATYAWSFPSGTPSTSSVQNPGAITYSSTGTFTISVDVTNECGTTSATQPVTVATVTTAEAGPPQSLCGTTVTMAANTPVIGAGLWSYVSGPFSYIITALASPTTTITNLIPGTYTFKWTITNGSCISSSNVTITIVAGPTAAAAGPDQNLCLAASATLAANTPVIGTGQWILISPATPPPTFTITDPSLPTTTVTGLTVGVYIFRWTTSFNNCVPSTDDIQVTVYDNPTVADAGPDQTICASAVTMAGNTPLIGNGTWTFVSGPVAIPPGNILTPASPSTIITGLTGAGNYIFKWKISNGVCPPTEDIVQITVTGLPTIAAAGPDQTLCAATTLTLAGNNPVVGTGEWTYISGAPVPATTPVITNPSLPSTTVTGLQSGTVYTFQWTITNGICPPSNDQVTITINDNVTAANAGPPQTLCGNTVTMAANTPLIGTGLWSPVPGATITNSSSPATTVTGLIPGVYIFTWTITNGSCISSSNVTITIVAGPTPAAAGPDQNLCLAVSTTLAANTPVIGTGQWTLISPATPPPTFTITDPTLPATTVTGLGVGIYIFRWTTSFGNCTPSTDDIQVTIYDNPTVANAGPNQTICASVVTMAGNTPTIGTGQWSALNGGNITNSSSPTTTITGLTPGLYSFKWTISNGACPPSESFVDVFVTAAATISNAGSDQTLCAATSVTLAGNTPTIGTGVWTPVPLPGTATITNPGFPNTTITGLQPGITYTFQWTITNGVCPPSTDQVQIINLNDLVNTISAPIITICASQSVTITGAAPTGGNGAYTYQWEQSADGVTNWTAVLTAGTNQSYTTTLATSMCFRRKVTSLPCQTYSNVVCITVQAAVAANTIAANQSICINTAPATITGSVPTGGNGVYTYLWQQSTDGGTNWLPAIGPNTAIDYTPPVLITTTWYRRIVSTSLCSGPQANNSNIVIITVNQDSKALFTANPTIHCAPFNLSTAITVTSFPDRNGLYQWVKIINGIESPVGSNTTGVFPGYTITNSGDTVIIKLVTTSQYGCKADSMQIEFITITTAVADFTRTPASGCGPLLVTFANTSTNVDNNTLYFWNFGNGILSTALQPGAVIYTNNPNFVDTTYYITLKAYNGCDTTYHRDSVKVFPNSKARFGVDTTRGCSPFTIHITNTSPGNNFNYYWDFGDGNRDTTHANGALIHTYNTPVITTYPIRLISENQCSRDTQTINLVVSPNTIQAFVSVFGNQLSGCAPHLATFSNSSVGASQLTWNFGDNTTPITTPNNQNIVTHLYNNAGNYTITIRLQNDCSDTTITRFVTVYNPPHADFTVAPVRICTNQFISVINTSTNANSYEWFWGDATSSTFTEGSHTYNIPGLYTITLVAKKLNTTGFICTDTIRKQITVVDKIPAQITVAPGNRCEPYTLNVNAGNITGYSLIEWFIYDNNTAPGVFQVTGLSASHIFNVAGNYSVKLIVHTTAGCTDTSTYNFEVFKTPKTTFDPRQIITCSHDTTVRFTAITTGNGTDPVTYKWFVNGAIQGTSNPFSYRFQIPLTNTSQVPFTIQALAQNTAGCGDTSLAGKLIIQPLPIPGIKVDPSLVLYQPHYEFTFKDTVTTNPNKTYTWNMGDPSLQIRHGQQVTYEYGDIGPYKVRLLVTDFTTGCSARDSVTVTILYVPGSLYVPNAFYPNSRINDVKTFLPIGIGLEKYHLQIFDAWGKLIFETKELNPDGSPKAAWDGKYIGSSTPGNSNGKPMTQDAFVWKIVEAKFKNGKDWEGMSYNGSPPRRFGTLTLFR
jgi:PKD repeat protein